jgi:biopolymer transport protein ExbB/TolQ
MGKEAVETVVQDPGFLNYAAKFMADGGIFMWLILGVWFLAVAIGIERLKFFWSSDTDAPSVMNEVKKSILDNQVHNALNLCAQSKSLLCYVLKSGLKRANQSRQQIQDILEATIIEANGKLEKRLSYIALCANISTLMGLLGTIYGLIQSFAAVAAADPSEKAKLLAEGISKAMNTTALGLISAITLLVIHSYLSSKASKVVNDIDENTMKLVDLLGTRKNKEYSEQAAG